MVKKRKIFIVTGLLLNLCIILGIYFYFQTNRFMDTIEQVEDYILEVSLEQAVQQLDLQSPKGNKYPEDTRLNSDSKVPAANEWVADTRERVDKTTSAESDFVPGVNQKSDDSLEIDEGIADAIQQRANQKVDKKDIVAAGLIILQRLDGDDIRFLYSMSQKDSYTNEELKKAREILLNKLTAEDIETIKEIGTKYGRSLQILNPDVLID